MDDPVVTHLPWICPSAASLAAIARRGINAAWDEIRLDPGAVLLIVACSPGCRTLPTLLPAVGDVGSVLETALRLLDRPDQVFVDWAHPRARPIYQSALAVAALAQRLAERTTRCDPANAWAAGLLAPLGRMALCARSATNPGRTAGWLSQPPRSTFAAEQQATRLARRLARRWQLPGWLTAVVGHLGLPAEAVGGLGADVSLFQIVQLSAVLVASHGAEAFLDVGGVTPHSAAAALNLSSDLDTLVGEAREVMRQPLPLCSWGHPQHEPLLRDLLHIAIDNQRLREGSLCHRLEDDLDALHHVVASQHGAEEETLRVRKLRALAEFAAGAGHEINNPLAVISGQSQFLLQRLSRTESVVHAEIPEAGVSLDPGFPPTLYPEFRRSLTTIVQQAQHIHQILRGLMQFARPATPHKHYLDLAGIVHEVVASFGNYASEKSVTLNASALDTPLLLHADANQIRTAVSCLVRNAIEASGTGGWVRVRVETLEECGLRLAQVVVEDSGPGAGGESHAQWREHLFDPFFSGRQAGRGRGLGLPTAWALAQQHGGDVRLASGPGEPTRFVLLLPQTLPQSEAA